MPIDPKTPLSPDEVRIYGSASYRHAVTGLPVELGSGALPPDVQALVVHCPEIERREGKAVADEVRRKLQLASRPLASKKD
jgi:hypothetical protein